MGEANFFYKWLTSFAKISNSNYFKVRSYVNIAKEIFHDIQIHKSLKDYIVRLQTLDFFLKWESICKEFVYLFLECKIKVDLQEQISSLPLQ